MECKICLFDDNIAKIDADGVCEYCNLHLKLEKDSNPNLLEPLIKKIQKKGKGKQYDCLIGISGGFDSSLLLEYAVKKWKLRPLVIHFDNGWNELFAKWNMTNMVNALNVDFIQYQVNRSEYDKLCRAFLMASTPDIDIPNDIIMTALMYRTAHQYKIKYILNGHDFRTEGSTPKPWTYMDTQYIKSVYEHFEKTPIKTLPLLSIWDQIKSGFYGIQQVRPFYYMEINRDTEYIRLQKDYGWEPYDLKHGENQYTAYVGYKVLPKKFKIDKRRVYLSAQIRAGEITKEFALKRLKETPMLTFAESDIASRLNIPVVKLLEIFHQPIKYYTAYGHYDFRKYRLIFWLLTRLKVLPYTFYYKYCK